MPKLKATLASLDGLSEELAKLYTQVGDEYVLDLDDKEYSKKLSEFRTNNRSLHKELESLKGDTEKLQELQNKLAAFDGIDPKVAKEAMETQQKIKDKKLLDEGKFEEVFDQRTGRMRRDFENKIDSLSKALEKESGISKGLRDKLSKVVIDDLLTNSVLEVATPRNKALPHILHSGREIFKLEDDKDVPMPRDGKGDIIYGKEPNKPLSPKEWAEGFVSDYPWMFEPSRGGGSGGSRERRQGDRTVSRDDPRAMGDNLQGLADGSVTLDDA